ncbi:MAG TPA: glutaredoxin family protein [Bacillota bacterium]
MSEITVFTTPTCPWCSRVKAYLHDKGVSFDEVNVASDRLGAERMIALTGQRSVPVIAKGNQYVVGFDPDRLEGFIH